METNYSRILRNLITEIDSAIEENIRFVEGGTNEARYDEMEGMYTAQRVVKDLLTKKALASENQAETEWQEGLQREALRHKLYQGRDLLKDLTNKRQSTVLKMNEDELEMALAKFNYFWQAEEKSWVQVS